MEKTPPELVFISQINRDGSGTTPVCEGYVKAMNENPLMRKEKYNLYRLSITEDTYIAHGFNSFVVRLNESKSESAPPSKQGTKAPQPGEPE